MSRVYNFSAGPSMLPLEVLETAQKELIEFANLSHADVLKELKTTKKFDKELMDRTAEVINEFKLTFKPGAAKEN